MSTASTALNRPGKAWISILIGTFIVGTLVMLIVPAVQKVREAGRRTQSINNLKNIALAARGFHDGIKRLPFNGVSEDVAGTATTPLYKVRATSNTFESGSWAFQIMPYVDSNPYFGDPSLLRHTLIPCPGRPRPDEPVPYVDYYINNYVNEPTRAEAPDNADAQRQLKDITDGESNTILIGHGNISTLQYMVNNDVVGSGSILIGGTFGTARAGPNWRKGQTPSVTLQRDSEAEPDFKAGGWGGPFSQGALMAMGDATVRMFPYHCTGGVIRNGVSTVPDPRPLIGDGHPFPENFNTGLGVFLTPTGEDGCTLPDS